MVRTGRRNVSASNSNRSLHGTTAVVRIGDGALGKGSSWQETSQRDGAVANSETPNAKSETNQKHKERAFQTCTTLDARTQPRSITRQWRIAATEVTMSECAGLCPRPSQTTLQRPFRNVESTTVTWSPFARRKGVLSRSEGRHLFPRRSYGDQKRLASHTDPKRERGTCQLPEHLAYASGYSVPSGRPGRAHVVRKSRCRSQSRKRQRTASCVVRLSLPMIELRAPEFPSRGRL